MSNINNGGPAFPGGDYKTPIRGGAHMTTIVGGMILRDYFAAKAMQALLHNWKEEVVPQMAYRIADEMLDEREK